MPWFEDLQPCTAFPGEWRNLVAVGWLAKGHEFAKGEPDVELLQGLARAGGWQPPGAPTGRHVCDLCPEPTVARSGTGALFVPGDGVLYVAPRLIAHYVRKHGYAPPPAFRRALLEGPRPYEPAYRAAIGHHFDLEPVEQYAARDIEVLDGLESVRRRPGMYIGSSDGHGLAHMFFEIVANSLDEYLAGFARQLRVQFDDRGWVSVEDDGRGIPIEQGGMDGTSALEAIFTQLHYGATLDGHHPHVHIRQGLKGVGIAAVNALCSRLEVESRRSGVAYRAAFACGRVVEPLRSAGPTTARGTLIRYLADDEIFEGDARLDAKEVELRLRELARLCPQLELFLQAQSLKSPAGLPGWVLELAPDVVKETALSAVGRVDDVDVEVALAWSPSGAAPQVRSYVNYYRTQQAGSHEQGLISAVRHAVPRASQGIQDKVLAGLVAVVHVGLLDPRFKGPTRAALEVDAARVAVHDIVSRAISNAPWWWDRLHETLR